MTKRHQERASLAPWACLLGLGLALGACDAPAGPWASPGEGDVGGADAPTQPSVEALAPRERLIRLSMDLLGVHPSEAELVAIEQSPGLYGEFVDRYIADPRFEGRFAALYNLRFHTQTHDLYFDTDGTELEGVDRELLAAQLGAEPLMLLRHILRNDLPFSEIVTAPFTFATPLTAAYWDLDYPAGAVGWQQATYKDGRPAAGMLSMSVLWQRYPSAGGNANRHRANTLSRLFLCDDFLARPIVVNRTAVDQLSEDPETAIRTNESCQSCHSALDPLAGSLFGFFRDDPDPEMTLEKGRIYRPENELLWKSYSGRSPGFFGRPISGIAELGAALAEDPRFTRCAVETVFEGLTQRHLVEVDWSEFEGYHDAFIESDQNLKALTRAIVTHPYYGAGRVVGDRELALRLPTVKTASPGQLADLIEDLTGYRWTFGGVDGLTENVGGLQVLAGGVDSRTVLDPTYMPAVGASFVQERLAQSAAHHVVKYDLSPDRPGDPYLLAFVTPKDTPDSNPEGFDAQIRHLYLTTTGIPLGEDAPEVAELTELWIALHSLSASPQDAWTGVVTAALRDPRILFY